MKLLVINGPNLNMLGIREPALYGSGTYDALCEKISAYCAQKNIAVDFYQSNHEGCLVDRIHPGAYTHTSIALLDAVKSVCIPTVEVHISKVEEREDFRQVSYIRAACVATITGKGFDGYLEAIDILEKTQ